MDSATEAPGELEDQVREDATPGVAEREQGSDPEAGAPALLQSESALSAADIIQAAIRNQTNRDDEHQVRNCSRALIFRFFLRVLTFFFSPQTRQITSTISTSMTWEMRAMVATTPLEAAMKCALFPCLARNVLARLGAITLRVMSV